MEDKEKTKARLIGELEESRQQVAKLESECQLTEEKLRVSEKKSLAWLEHSPVCTKIVDLDFKLQYMSTAGVQSLKIDDITEYYGKPYPLEFYPESFRDRMNENLLKVKTSGEIAIQEASVVDIDGTELWFHSTLVPVNDDQGRIDYIIVVSADITERKRLEAQFVQSQKMEAIGTLAGGIAHDFNNLLTPILGFAELAQRDLDPKSDELEYLESIERSARRAKELVERILLISRSSLRREEPTPLKNLLEEVLTVLEASISPNIDIHQEIDSELPLISADPSSIYQMILNLCTNAAQAMQQEGVLSIKLNQVEHPPLSDDQGQALFGDFICLTVKDSGCGMDAATLERIYEPFFTTKEKRGQRGTGLGLSIVSSVVKQHRGQIEVESQLGEGTIFRAYFPVLGKEESPAVRETPSLMVSGDEHILLVDDDQMVNNFGTIFLKHLGYRVTSFTDSRAALKTFEANPQEFQLVITDCDMPRLTGLQLMAKARAIRSDIPMILVTGHSNLATPENIQAWKCDEIIAKPYDIKELSQAVSQAIARAKS